MKAHPHPTRNKLVAIAMSAVGLIGLSTVLATAASSSTGPTKGRIPDAAFKDGGVIESMIPDYVPALNNAGNPVGYVAKVDMLSPDNGDKPIEVRDESLKRVIGHMHPGRGFVSQNQRPEDVPKMTVVTFNSN